MTNGFGGITSFMFLRTVFLKKAGEKKKSANYLKMMEHVIKMGFIGGSLASILRGLFIAFIFNHVGRIVSQLLHVLIQRLRSDKRCWSGIDITKCSIADRDNPLLG